MAQYVDSYESPNGRIALGDRVTVESAQTGYRFPGTVTRIIKSGPGATVTVRGERSGRTRNHSARRVYPDAAR
jgi:hypothetical protein